MSSASLRNSETVPLDNLSNSDVAANVQSEGLTIFDHGARTSIKLKAKPCHSLTFR